LFNPKTVIEPLFLGSDASSQQNVKNVVMKHLTPKKCMLGGLLLPNDRVAAIAIL
jgi:hypothetical protein